jgi:glucose-1-phosphate thymidylyltransferase
MLAAIREILIITTPTDRPAFERLLGDGRRWGITLSYAEQAAPEGIAQAFLVARDFLGGAGAALTLGDNLYYGEGMAASLAAAAQRHDGATIFAYRVRDPQRYGVVDLDAEGRPLRIEEKPPAPTSPWAVTGLYFCDARAVDIAAGLTPSPRGELEITDLLADYLARGALHVERLGRGFAWLDAGTPESLVEAGAFVRVVERRQRFKIACVEEVAYRMGFIDRAQLRRLADSLGAGDYAAYLREIADER